METVRNIAQSVLPESLKQATMVPSEDTFAARAAAQFTGYEKDCQTKSQQTIYATRYVVIRDV
jgi:predicted YcjX-like family ATPase